MAITPLPVPAPQRGQAPETFITNTDALLSALPTMVTQMNTDIATTNGNVTNAAASAASATTSASSSASYAASAATSAANAATYGAATLWVSGSLYVVGQVRVSPADSRLYRRITNGGGSTDPSLDVTNWTLVYSDSGVQALNITAVVASLPTLNYIDACFHFARDDADKGAWRKRKGTTWRTEARSAGKYLGSYATAALAVAAGGTITDIYYNTTNSRFEEITVTGTPASTVTRRAGREDYPTNALITVEAARFVIWDLDYATPSMWMVFNQGTNYIAGATSEPLIAVCAKNSSVVIGAFAGSTGRVTVINFADEYTYYCNASGKYRKDNKISERNTGVASSLITSSTTIVNVGISGLAITALETAPVDSNGIPVPTIGVATAGGVTVLTDSGTSVNSASTAAAYGIMFDSLGRARWNTTTEYNCSPLPPLSASFTASSATEPKLSQAAYSSSNVPISPAIATGTGIACRGAIASTNGLTLHRTGQSSNALFAAITTTYNTGWMLGDIRRCWLSNSKTSDRSLKNKPLTETGALTETTYSGGRSVYSNFSASNYLMEAYSADMDFGTGDFCVTLHYKTSSTAATTESLLERNDATRTNTGRFSLIRNGQTLYFYVGTTAHKRTSNVLTANVDYIIQCGVKSGVIFIYINGEEPTYQVVSGSPASVDNGTANLLAIGVGTDGITSPATTATISNVRISATVPTLAQARYVASTELQITDGVACLLSNSDSVSKLTFDNDTNVVHVGNGVNIDEFVNLMRITSYAHGTTTLKAVTGANSCECYVGTGGTFVAPERNINAELLEAQIRVPRTQNYSFTTPVATTTKVLPQGWRAKGVAFNLTDGTMLSVSQTFDGFEWTLSGLTAGKAYQVFIVENI